MRRSIAIVAGLLAMSLATSTPPASAAARTKRCSTVTYSAGGGYYVYRSSSIRARRVRCSRARRVARVPPQTVSGTGTQPRRFRRNGFACRGRAHGATKVTFRCTRKRMLITFAWTAR